MIIDKIMLVVVYNKTIENSMTLKTIAKYRFNNTKLLIHNNGPSDISLDEKLVPELYAGFDIVELVNHIENKPLSMLYNEFIGKNDKAQKYIILDDDTVITESFYNAVMSSSYDLELPRIVSCFDGETYYPMSSGKVVNSDGILDARNTLSIGSGLIINKSLLEKFRKHNMKIFNESYALYGVDFSLFRNIRVLIKRGEIFNIHTASILYHSLSRVEGGESTFRTRERLMDFSLSLRHYPTPRLYASFIKKLIILLLQFNINDFMLMIKIYLSGKHPRCNVNR